MGGEQRPSQIAPDGGGWSAHGACITVLVASFILSPLFPNSQLVLMSLLCSTLTSKVDAEDAADGASGPLFEACRDLAPLEPEFILKVPWCEGE